MENYIKQLKWSIIKILSNLSFAIILLTVILFLSILSTIIEQNRNLEFYKETYSQSLFNNKLIAWQLIITLGLNHMASNYWFILLLILLAISLITCTFVNQIPIFKIAKTWSLLKTKKKYQNFNFFTNRHYYTFQHYEFSYAYKGLIGRLAPMIVHLSIVLILSGSMIGYTQGFIAQEFIPKGEMFHIQNIIDVGPIANVPQNLTGKVHDFFIQYENKRISQYFSNISLLNDSNLTLAYKSIFVNQPLTYKNITIYQTDWNLLGLRIQSYNSNKLQIFLQKINDQNLWISTIRNPKNPQEEFSLLLFDLTGDLLLYDKQNYNIKFINLNITGQLVNQLQLNHKIAYYNRPFKVIDIMTSTGLQIKSDPGIILVYIGFLLLIISTIFSYLSYSQLWISRHNSNNQYQGITNRAIIYFEKECSQMLKSL
uniref:c-type cytochrome biogenensis protein n=1 Tax=Dixoniella grisea TaxID=35153 RepID=UPI001FCDEFD2|nr:c-type cytochrome biogenensis protein [Dixoniella grisea]UNJ17185.1 c-type cytochrome biogenensis protein [Dixoniella grisea]